MKRSRYVALAAAAVAAGGGVISGASLASASSAAAPTARGFAQVVAYTGATGAAAAPSITGSKEFDLYAYDSGQYDTYVDVGAKGQSAGDYFLFSEQLKDSAGNVVGMDHARCMLARPRNELCDGTFTFFHKGDVEIGATVSRNDLALSVTGGTARYQNVRGQFRIVGGSQNTTHFKVTLLP